jgi:hypothetical protein
MAHLVIEGGRLADTYRDNKNAALPVLAVSAHDRTCEICMPTSGTRRS